MTTFRGCVTGYCQIQIVNGTYGAITTPFQQYISVPITSSIQNMISDIRQINFQDGNGNIIPAWLESASGTLWASASMSAVNYWLKLTSPATISAGATVTVYMCFNSINVMDGITTGCAPQLTSTYAQYDNGTNVFALYINGNTPTSDFATGDGDTVTQQTGITLGSSTINALRFTSGSLETATTVDMFTSTSLPNNPNYYILESHFQSDGSTTDRLLGLAQNSGTGVSNNGIFVGCQFGGAYFDEAYISSGTKTININSNGSTTTSWRYLSLTYPSASSFYGYISPQLYSTTGGYSGTVNTNPISSITPLYFGFYGNVSGAGPWIQINYARVRIYPPNGVMPAAKMITIPISISNNQNTATPAPFQQFITINPVQLGSNNFSADLGNIRFYSDPALTQPLYAWVESGNSNTVSATNIWVKLPNGVPANSTVTIYMALGSVGAEYDGVYMGEAPLLSSTYGQYDNGANVFNNYWNFAGTSLPSGFTQVGTGYAINNGFEFQTSGTGSDNAYLESTSTFTPPVITEAYIYPTNGGWIGFSQIGNYSTGGVLFYYFPAQDGWQMYNNSTLLYYTGNDAENTYYILSSTMLSGGIAILNVNYNLVTITSSSGYYSGTSGNLYIGGNGGSGTMYWLRTRAYPPNGTMPTIALLTPMAQPIPITQLPPMF
ncbi:MAG: DUF2341 domain-containing protein [Candidatus Parvarchaeota archaeon]